MNMQQALGSAGPAAEADTKAAASVPRQAGAEPKRSRPKKTAAAGAGKAAPKKPAATAASAKTSTAAGKPSLVDLVRNHLEQQNEPRSAAEISSALTQAHPDRAIKTTVVRTTVEGLVAKGHVHRTEQGSSVPHRRHRPAVRRGRAAAGDSRWLSSRGSTHGTTQWARFGFPPGRSVQGPGGGPAGYRPGRHSARPGRAALGGGVGTSHRGGVVGLTCRGGAIGEWDGTPAAFPPRSSTLTRPA